MDGRSAHPALTRHSYLPVYQSNAAGAQGYAERLASLAAFSYRFAVVSNHTRRHFMKRVVALTVLLVAAPVAFASQVTGPVVEVTDTKIVVDLDGEQHEMARTKDTKVSGAVKKGDKVTVQYKMTATNIEVKKEEKKKK
jgi:hypothetical protein